MLSCAPPRKSRENFTARRLCKSMVGAEKDIQIDSLIGTLGATKLSELDRALEVAVGIR